MSAALAGLTVVVTRPRPQAGDVTALLESAGARVLAFPTLAIEPVDLDEGTRTSLNPDAHDWTIFTSANAVEHALARLARPGTTGVAAVGRATAAALHAHGIRVDAVPDGRADSEALLALAGFVDVSGRKVLVLRGVGGREWLREELARRGAIVTVGEIYRRVSVEPSATAISGLGSALRGSSTIVAVTSVEVLDALLRMAPQADRDALLRTPLLLPGSRVEAAARERGWRGPLIASASAEDATMVATLVAWRKGGATTGAC